MSGPGAPAASIAPSSTGHPGLLARLMATVRPEFRRDELVFDPEDPVFGGPLCTVSGCGRTARGRGLCEGHHQRWAEEGRPDLDHFAATTSPRWRRQQPNAGCRIPECGYGVARDGMCQLHAQRWARSGRPALDAWLADPPAVKQPPPGATCLLSHCDLWPQADLPYCHSHAATWKVNGRPGPAVFAARFAETGIPGHERIYLHQLGPQLKLELQYALQCRHDERRSKVQPFVVMLVIRFLAGCPVTSLLDRTEQEWRQAYGRPAPKDSTPRAFLAYTHRRVEDLAGQDYGWDTEYPCGIWRLHNLGFAGRQTLRFDQIPQPWLQDLAKRWVRWRLSTGLCLEASRRAVRALTRFAQFLASPAVNASQLVDIRRPVLEQYLADLHAEMAGSQRQGSHIGLLNTFFQAIRQHGWDDTLPASATFFTTDYPKRTERLPRALAEHVMTQIEHPATLARWDNPAYQLITLILIRCGLRISDALRLGRDCVITDTDSAPYLRYFNHKMKREALVPIDEELQGLIGEQQRRVLARWPAGPGGLFPRPTGNIDGQVPVSSSTYRLALYRWLEHCHIRDEHGRPVHFTPHQWRHTLGTRMINRDVPQEVVRRILGPRLIADDRALCPAVGHHDPPALGEGPQGQHQRPDRHPRPGRAGGRGGMGQAADQPRHPGAAQRLLRASPGQAMPTRQRVPDLPDVHHYRRVPAPAPRPPPAGPADHLNSPGRWPGPAGRDEPAGRQQPRKDHHSAGGRPCRHRAGGNRRCVLTTPGRSSPPPSAAMS